MLHAKFCKPRVFPWNSAREPEQISRLQDLSGDLTLNREELFEIGREDRLGYRKQTPSLSFSARQYEYGSMAFWYTLANKVNPDSGEDRSITLDDLGDKKCELAAFLTDEADLMLGTIYLPNVRVNGFSINIGDPDAIVERNFDLVSEKYRIIDGKFLAYADDIVGILGTGVDYTLHFGATGEPIVPIAYATGKYIYRVLRVRGDDVSDLLEDVTGTAADSWKYVNGTKTLTVLDCLEDDLIKVYYAADTAYIDVWTDNTPPAGDPTALLADYTEIRIKVGTGGNGEKRIHKLQSVGIDVAFDRADYKEIGTSEAVQTDIKSASVTVALNRFLESFSLEKILAGDSADVDIDPENFSEEIQLQILIYDNKAHTGDIKIGYLAIGLTPSTTGFSQSIEDFMSKTTNLIGTNLKISSDETEVAFI